MNLIDKTASPPQKLHTILLHIRNYQNAFCHKSSAVAPVIDISCCYTNFDSEYFGLSSYAEMKFYLDALIDRNLIDVLGDEVLQREEFQRKINFPRKIRIHDMGVKAATRLKSPDYADQL